TTGNEIPSSINGNIATLTINNASGVLLNSADITIAGSLTLTNGIFYQQNNTINFITSNTPLVRTNGTLTTVPGSVLNFGTPAAMLGNTVLVPANFFTNNPTVIGSLGINKSVAGQGLTWNNQGLTINGTLTLNMNGAAFNIGANTLTFQNNDVPVVKTSGTITTAAGTSLVFGTAGNTAGAAFSLPATLFTAAPAITSLTINRDNKLTWTNQQLTLSNTLTLTGGEFDFNGQTLITNAAIPFARTTGTFTPGAAGTMSFTANATPFTIPDGFFTTSPATITNLTLNRGAGILVSLGNQELNVTGTTTLTAATGGILEIKNSDLQIATLAGTPSVNSMIVTNGTGYLKRNFPSGASVFTFPVGDNSGTAEYSPASITFTANATAGSIGVRVTDAKHPFNTEGDNYITRYWSFSAPALSTYNYSAVYTYPTADVVGADEANFKMQRYDNGTSSWTADIGSNTVPGANSTLNTSSLTETTGKLDNNDFTSFSAADVYYWSRNTANWNAANAWVVTNINVDPGAGGTPTVVPPSYSNNKGITVRNGHSITVNLGTYTADQMTVATGGILLLGANNLTVYNDAGTDLTIDGTLTTTGGQIISNDPGTDIAINGILNTADLDGLSIDANSTISTTNTPAIVLGINSTINFNGAAGQKTDSRSDYANLQVSAIGTKTAQGAITVNRDLTITTGTLADNGNIITVKGNIVNNGTHSGTGKIYLNGGAGAHAISGGTSAFGNLELDDSNGATFTGTGTTNITGNLVVTQGTLTLNAFTTALNVTGTTTVGNGGSVSAIIMNSVTGTKSFTGLMTIGGNGTWNNIANEALTLQGGITNNGVFTAGTGVHTFNTNAQSLTGTFIIPSVTVTGITLTNDNSLTVNTALAGTGALTQAANAVLNIGFIGAVGITTLNADAAGNTVTYNFAGAQTIKSPSVAYNHLVTDISGTKTLAAATTVNGDLTISAGTLATAGFILQVKGNAVNNGIHSG
ncbi:MAG: hypothetical protein HZB98_12295, partial [Bacteroidia bacterium]|nr:hypothetical protein [Bacteroidia bacterium]